MPTKTDKRLRGTWKSDRLRTIAEWRFTKRLSTQKKQWFFNLFGKLRLTYTPTRIHEVLGKYRTTQRYEVLAKDSESVAIRYEDTKAREEWRIEHIHFEGPDSYWIALGQNREWFRRVKVKNS